jgi:transposase
VLHGEDPTPLIHQVAELPKIEPMVDEYRLHRLSCPDCGTITCATLPAGVPSGGYGPYLQAVLATLAGAYRLIKKGVGLIAIKEAMRVEGKQDLQTKVTIA